ncbi:helix-turn-helix domain-containing protein [Comamonas sp. Sa2CVA6]|uniref:Helix-turn-helix domain-containing protein n=1 Tax=Comamonas avium TaxID=2762231 RepID=A0ABR8SDE8_9BURK|nr:helix-turn-helix domain-containing protein [Comamonas avium]
MIDAKAVAKLLGLSERTVYELARSGRLHCYRFGAAVRFDETDVEEYKKSCRSVMTHATSVGALSSTRLLRASGSGLAAYFQKATPNPKPKSSTSKKPSDSTPLRLASASQNH